MFIFHIYIYTYVHIYICMVFCSQSSSHLISSTISAFFTLQRPAPVDMKQFLAMPEVYFFRIDQGTVWQFLLWLGKKNSKGTLNLGRLNKRWNCFFSPKCLTWWLMEYNWSQQEIDSAWLSHFWCFIVFWNCWNHQFLFNVWGQKVMSENFWAIATTSKISCSLIKSSEGLFNFNRKNIPNNKNLECDHAQDMPFHIGMLRCTDSDLGCKICQLILPQIRIISTLGHSMEVASIYIPRFG